MFIGCLNINHNVSSSCFTDAYPIKSKTKEPLNYSFQSVCKDTKTTKQNCDVKIAPLLNRSVIIDQKYHFFPLQFGHVHLYVIDVDADLRG